MKDISSFFRKARKVVLPSVFSTCVFFGGCGRGDIGRGNSRSSNGVDSKPMVVFNERDFSYEGKYGPVYFNPVTGRAVYPGELKLSNAGELEFSDEECSERDFLAKMGYGIELNPSGVGPGIRDIRLNDSFGGNFFYLGENCIKYDEHGNLMVKPILDELEAYKSNPDLCKREFTKGNPYAVYYRKAEGGLETKGNQKKEDYILVSRGEGPGEVKFDLYKLNSF